MDKTNVLLITVDTLRADHLGCYGYHRDTSPNIDKLASEGTLFENFFCAGIPTQPSYTTLYTGQHPITHGVVAHGGKAQLERDAPFMPQSFLGDGYTTCAVDNMVLERSWFIRGYEFYINPGVRRPLILGVTCEELNHRVIPWLKMHHEEPFFLMLHYWDPHWPLDPPAHLRDLYYEGNPTNPDNHSLDEWWQHPLGSMARDTWARRPEGPITDAEYIEALYDQEIRHLDEGVGELLATIDELGLRDNTLVAFVADHGESMTEHNIYFEHHGLYDSVIHVPFILRLPGKVQAGARRPNIFQMHDVAPTLLEATGVEIPDEMDGISAWDLATGASDEGGREYAISVECTWQAKWSLRSDRHKLILARQPDMYGNPPRELYDLQTDPGEERNLADEEPELAANLEAELEGWISRRLEELGKPQDPIVEQGVTIGAGMFGDDE